MGQKRRHQPAKAPTTEAGSPHAAWIAAALLIVLCVVAYHNALEGPLIFDDVEPIERSGVIKLPFWQISDAYQNTARPVLFYALAVNYQLCGLDDPPVGFHVFNVAVHLAAALVLFDLIRRTLLLPLLREKYESRAPWLAFAVAAIWLVHPLQTQTVNYTIQRCESMMALCFLLTLYGLVWAAGSKRPWLWYAVSVAACAIGMGCKQVMIVAPLVALIYDRVFLVETFQQIFRKKWFVYAGMLLACAWLVWRCSPAIERHVTTSQPVAGAVAAVSSDNAPRPSAVATPRPQGTWVSPWEYGMTQAGVILHYLRLSFWPHPLCLDYWTWPVVREFRQAVVPGLAVVALLVASFMALWRWPPIAFLGVSFFLILAPTSSFFPIQDLVFEHRMYLPLAALMTLAVFAGYHLLEWLFVRTTWSPQVCRGIVCGLLVAVLGLLLTMTIARNRDYQSRIAIWQSVVEVFPTNDRAWQHLGAAYFEQGRLAEAAQALMQGAEWNPQNPWIMSAIAEMRLSQGKPGEAVALWQAAVALAPSDPELQLNLGVGWESLNRIDKAIDHYRKAVKFGPTFVKARNNLGLALVNTGKIDEGMAELEHALRLDGDNVDALGFMGYALMQQQHYDAAIEYLQTAVRIEPDSFATHDRLAIAYETAGRFEEAIDQWQQAAELADRQQPGAGKMFRARIEQLKTRRNRPQ
jgi:tetratricopeptide (TPR) repeat protein